jgi:hypothetical protein
MPALIGSGSVGHAWTMAANSGSKGQLWALSAPDFAPLWDDAHEFPVVSLGSSIPAASTFFHSEPFNEHVGGLSL